MAHLEGDRGRSALRAAYPGLVVRDWRRGPLPAGRAAALVAVLLLLAWEAAAQFGLIKPLFFPAPSTIVATIVALTASGVLPGNAGATLGRVLLGVLLGGLPAIALGLAMGWWPRLRAFLDPYVAGAHAVPKIAILPLILIFFGVDEMPKVIVAALGAFFPLLINTIAGVRQIHNIYLEVAENYGASRSMIFTRVLLPGSLPSLLAGLQIALNTTLLLTIAVEMISARTGLGTLIWRAWETMRTEELYASLAVIMLLGIGFNLLTRLLTAYCVPWQGSRRA